MAKKDRNRAAKDGEKETQRGVAQKDHIEENSKSEDQSTRFTFDPLKPYKGLLRRFLQIQRHVLALFGGGLLAYVASLPAYKKKGLRSIVARFWSFLIRPFILKEVRNKPFAHQLRRRLELLGPTYIKLGQILSLREDILPRIITEELKNLLDRLPEVPFKNIRDIIQENNSEDIDELFEYINPKPLGSASIAQTHLARIKGGDTVVLKIMKPGIRDTVLTDITLLNLLAHFLQWAIPQYQPKRLINEFCFYTKKEVDFQNEMDNADIFATNFADEKDILFPKIYREFSNENVICMEFMDGFKPGAPETDNLENEERKKLVDLGSKAIIRMLYKDGFFHADLHPGNLMILPGAKVGFIDLGMVGRFEEETRRKMLYYFHSLVTGDISGATRYLSGLATVGEGGNMNDFRRSVADLLRRYYQHSKYGDFSLARMILQSMTIGAKHKVFFPVEMTLMTKALVTFEGVGKIMDPELDITEVSQKHVNGIFMDQYSPRSVVKELMRGTPELADIIMRSPKIMADSLRYLEESVNTTPTYFKPPKGLRSSILAGACIIGGTIGVVMGGPWFMWGTLFTVGFILALFGK